MDRLIILINTYPKSMGSSKQYRKISIVPMSMCWNRVFDCYVRRQIIVMPRRNKNYKHLAFRKYYKKQRVIKSSQKLRRQHINNCPNDFFVFFTFLFVCSFDL